jgi:hypothetical protein
VQGFVQRVAFFLSETYLINALLNVSMKSKNLNQKIGLVSKKKLEAARLCGNYEDKNLHEAIHLLAGAGFEVYASPVSYMDQIELNYGVHQYVGIQKIRKFVKHYKKTQEIPYP